MRFNVLHDIASVLSEADASYNMFRGQERLRKHLPQSWLGDRKLVMDSDRLSIVPADFSTPTQNSRNAETQGC